MTTGLLGARRANELLWSNLRLVVLDVETLWESGNSLPDEADAETRAAIERVRESGTPVVLRPQRRRVRYFQHQAIEAAGLTSESVGLDPGRCVEVRPGTGAPLPPPDQQPVTHEGRHRAISIAAVEVVRGRVKPAPFAVLVNPGVPVDRETVKIHKIETRHLADAPDFARVAPDLLARLTARDGETLVLVAHNAPFDVGVLRTEFELIGHTFPALPVLDTHGPIVRHVGIAPRDGSLAALLAALRIAHADAHTAKGDALATAAAAIEILRLASEKGIAYAPALLDAAGTRNSAQMAPPGRIRPSRHEVASLPADHLDTHLLLGAKPTAAARTAWITMANRCAALGCPDLGLAHDGLVRSSPAAPDRLLDALAAALRLRAAAGDGPGAHTVLGAIAAVFEQHCRMPADHAFSGTYPVRRKAAIETYHAALDAVRDLPACRPHAACVSCQRSQPCPRTELVRAVAPAVLDPVWDHGRLTKGSTLLAWFRPNEAGGWFYHQREPGTTPYWPRGGMKAGRVLADATLALMLRAYRMCGEEPNRFSEVQDEITRAIEMGCEDPALVEMWVERLATGGRLDDLREALAACEASLANRPDPSDSAWASLGTTADQIGTRITRMVERKRIAPDGTVEVLRWRNPGPAARRYRPLRFVRP